MYDFIMAENKRDVIIYSELRNYMLFIVGNLIMDKDF